MKTRAQVLAERKAAKPAPEPTPPALTFKDLEAFITRTGVSVHLRAQGGKFIAVAHHAPTFTASDATHMTLEHGLRTVMHDYDAGGFDTRTKERR